MYKKKVLIVGEIFVDTHLYKIKNNKTFIQLGGIFHSARALSAFNIDFAMAYYAPEYLEQDINLYNLKLNSLNCFKLGNITKSPNVMLIEDSKESGYQGYQNILCDQAIYEEPDTILNIIEIVKPTDIIIYPGRYNTKKILNELQHYDINLHIDTHYDSEILLNNYEGNIKTIILSTSSNFFKNNCKGTFKGILTYLKDINVANILVKENRGGSYCYNTETKNIIESYSYPLQTLHSVGVGDVYNAIFISEKFNDLKKNMILASLIASNYAATLNFETFKKGVDNTLKTYNTLAQMKGIRLSWVDRSKIKIYMAAPDFPHINTNVLKKLGDCLKYHNFNPVFPIQENGFAKPDLSENEKLQIYCKDLKLLETCDLLIATVLYNDPGTFVELGCFGQMKKHTILFDPFKYCDNLFAKNFATHYCQTINQVIEKTFELMGNIINEERI